MTLRPDLHGRAGWRCDLHGGRLPCNVPGCGRTSVGRVAREDDCGLAGHRCYQHGARRHVNAGLTWFDGVYLNSISIMIT